MRTDQTRVAIQDDLSARTGIVRDIARLAMVAVVVALLGTTAVTSSAQQPVIDTALSETIIDTLGYPEITIEAGPEGFTAPSSLTAGLYQVTLVAAEPYIAYVNFMQPPAGLSEEEELELALAAASEDLVQPGWVYAGGNNTFEVGVPTKFIIELKPGEYKVATSYYMPEQGSEEVMRLMPLTVTASDSADATPVPEPTSAITMEETDSLRYVISPEAIPAGPQIWEITNTGELHAHHAVIFRIPEGVTADDIVSEFTAMVSGTPPAGEPLMAQFVHTGYSALQSGGTTTWVEFDFEPGTYAVICFIGDHHTGRPHVLDGMVTVFQVQ